MLLLIRHGESENNKLYRDTGTLLGRVPDPRLTEVGRRQAQILADTITGPAYPRVDRLRCSLMYRAIETAAPLADALDMPLIGDPDIFEGYGPIIGWGADKAWHPGSPRSVLAACTPRLVLPDSATEDGWWRGPVEEMPATWARAERVVERLRADDPGTCTAIVAHGTFGSCLLGAALGSDAWFELANASTSLILLGAGREATVEWINRPPG